MPNWVDILIVLLLTQQISVLKESNLIAESFKLLGALIATVVSLHYYSLLSYFLEKNLALFDKTNDLIALSFISTIILFVFFLIYKGWIAILRVNFPSQVDVWGGYFFGTLKAVVLTGLLFFALCISGIGFVDQAARSSAGSVIFQEIPINIYEVFYKNCIVRFFPEEKLNENPFALKLNVKGSEVLK